MNMRQTEAIATVANPREPIFPSVIKEPETQIKALQKLDLRQLADLVFANAYAHGFHDPNQSEGDFLAHMCCNKHGEISELYDAWRNNTLRQPCDKAEKMQAAGLPVLNCAEEEYADLIIRCLDECSRLNLDIVRAIAIKHLFNTTRPYKHGKLS